MTASAQNKAHVPYIEEMSYISLYWLHVDWTYLYTKNY